MHGTFFAATKYRTTFSDSENNSKYALQKPMQLKFKKTLKIGIANMIFPNDTL
jgi:hypothetical protein